MPASAAVACRLPSAAAACRLLQSCLVHGKIAATAVLSLIPLVANQAWLLQLFPAKQCLSHPFTFLTLPACLPPTCYLPACLQRLRVLAVLACWAFDAFIERMAGRREDALDLRAICVTAALTGTEAPGRQLKLLVRGAGGGLRISCQADNSGKYKSLFEMSKYA